MADFSTIGGAMKKKFFGAVALGAAALALLSGCAVQDQVSSTTMEQATQPLTCMSKAECDAWWARAQVWVTNHSEYKLQTVTDSIIQTAGRQTRARVPDHQDADQRGHRDHRFRGALRQSARLPAESVGGGRRLQAVHSKRSRAAENGDAAGRYDAARRTCTRACAERRAGQSAGSAGSAQPRKPAGPVGGAAHASII
jgi:hypothetical protein